jgi:hypothetical protein
MYVKEKKKRSLSRFHIFYFNLVRTSSTKSLADLGEWMHTIAWCTSIDYRCEDRK